MPGILIESLFCFRCEHRWYPRNPRRPKVCPKCKRTDWDKYLPDLKRKKQHCPECGRNHTSANCPCKEGEAV